MEKGTAKIDEEDGSTDDRISELPQHISHRILSLLPQKQAVRACVLSKTWRHLVSTRPNVELREEWFILVDEQTTHSVLDKTLQSHHDQKLSLQEFVLELMSYDDDDVCQSISVLKKWAPINILHSGVEVFSFSLVGGCSATFDLPPALFKSKSLRELYLEGCKIPDNNIVDNNNVLFRHLVRLHLKRVYISDEAFEKITSGCPLIGFLVLYLCKGLKTIKMMSTNNNLKDFNCVFLEDKEGNDYTSIEIDHVQAIESIRIERCSNWSYHPKSFPHLVSLDLYMVKLCSKSLDIFSSDFPCLEKLSLKKCYGFEEFKILTRSIKHLTIVSVYELIQATIDAPNIRSFKYSSPFPPSSISFTTISSEWKSEINVLYYINNGEVGGVLPWLLKLNGLLKALSQSQVFLHLSYPLFTDDQQDEDAINCSGFYEHVAVEHLSIMGEYSSSSFPAFLNLLFRTCRPRYIDRHAIVSIGDNSKLHQHLFKSLVLRDDNYYFWQKDLEQAIVETSDDHGKTWHHHVEETSLTNKNKTRFRLKWR